MSHTSEPNKCKIIVAVRLPSDLLDALKIIAREECPRAVMSMAIRKLLREGIVRRIVAGELKLPLVLERNRE